MAAEPGEVETIDAPLRPEEEELVTILDEPVEARRSREVKAADEESSPPAPDSEFFTAPVLDEHDTEMRR